jgi:hypothetical protein
LEREGLIAFLAPEKRGKSWMLLDMAFRAVLQRRKVAFFEVGDLSKNQIKRRFLSRVAGRPWRARDKDNPVRYPRKIVIEDRKALVEADCKIFPKPMDYNEAWNACQKMMQEKVRSTDSYFKMFNHPNDSVTVGGLREQLRTLEYSGWVPEVVVVDYADILAAPAGYKESRDGINATWKGLRRMSQELHCLVVTATQANATAYKSDSLDMTHYSEDKRKFAHVTGMIGINQSEDEKREGVQRLNWLVLREDEFYTSRYCYVASCLAMANPCVRSLMPG